MQIDIPDLIKAGQIIYIEDLKGSSWPFGVNNILNHELVVCQALGRKSTPLNVASSNLITIVVPDENGAYLVEAEIAESDEKRYRVALRPTGKTKYVQRRQYFRISRPSVLAHYQLTNSEADQDNRMPIEGMVWDLSGNGIGILVRSSKTIYVDSTIKIIISLPGEPPIELIGVVTRVLPKSIIKSEYLLGVHFKRIKESDRDKIIKFVMQEQLALRKVKKK